MIGFLIFLSILAILSFGALRFFFNSVCKYYRKKGYKNFG